LVIGSLIESSVAPEGSDTLTVELKHIRSVRAVTAM
jgi:hypothetical protein